MTDTQNTTPDPKGLIVRLRELIDSLDSRVPHQEREGEIRIAHEAAALKDKALHRLGQLETQDSDEAVFLSLVDPPIAQSLSVDLPRPPEAIA